MPRHPISPRIVRITIQPKTWFGKTVFILCFLVFFLSIFFLSILSLFVLLGVAALAALYWLLSGKAASDSNPLIKKDDFSP